MAKNKNPVEQDIYAYRNEQHDHRRQTFTLCFNKLFVTLKNDGRKNRKPQQNKKTVRGQRDLGRLPKNSQEKTKTQNQRH